MKRKEFEEWIQGFVDHFNFMSSRLPKPYKIEAHIDEVNDSSITKGVRIYYMPVSGVGRTLFYKQNYSLSAGAKIEFRDDWTELMQTILIDFMTSGADRMVSDTHKRNSK